MIVLTSVIPSLVQMAAVSIFLEAFDNADDYPVLNKLICQYRKVEEQTRRRCGLSSVLTSYPGCTVYTRGHSTATVNVTLDFGWDSSVSESGSNSTEGEASGNSTDRMVRRRMQQTQTAHDIMVEDYLEYSAREEREGESEDEPFQPRRLALDENEMDNINVDWEAFIQSVYAEEDAFKNGHRQLETDYTDVSWNNYFPMLGCKTEYYYRYSGTMTVPPCYGRLRLGADNRANTNNWRVMKDPIPVSKRQIDELHRLIRSRIAPVDDPLKACRADTAAATPDPENPSRVSVARPLQSNRKTHWTVFCECDDWDSKWTQDQNWCKLDKSTRFFDHPYNYDTDGF
jgi:Eukaryotic-type carbonic anhydrase